MMDRRIARRIILIAALLVFTMFIGTAGFRTITTVGYQEIRPAGRPTFRLCSAHDLQAGWQNDLQSFR
jgi:hypothetical protein